MAETQMMFLELLIGIAIVALVVLKGIKLQKGLAKAPHPPTRGDGDDIKQPLVVPPADAPTDTSN